jgi:glycosyltransferase involved in cell wall biosynthesis
LDIYSCREYLGVNYERLFADMEVHDNIHIHLIGGLAHAEMSKLVNKSQCVVICCFPANYTVGLTTVVEALALGIPLICTKNLQMPMDIEHEHCGITVEHGDIEGWVKAVKYIAENPDVASQMGRRGRALAEQVYNLDNCAKDVSEVLKKLIKR